MLRGYLASKIGITVNKAIPNGSSSTATPLIRTIVTAPKVPTMVVFLADVDCYVRIGSSAMPAAQTTDFLLKANTYWPLVIEGDAELYFRVYGTGAGTLRVTNAQVAKLDTD